MNKIIFHLDNDSYFASAHATIDPTIKGKPTVVSTNRKRSIVTAASYEAKKLGIKVPMPVYKAKEMCPDLIVLQPNFNLYTVLSTQLFEFISEKYIKEIEVLSIDECFIDVTKIWKKWGSPRKLALDMQKQIMKKFSLSVSIGISTNKFVAKMSTSINKPFGITITKPNDFLKTFGDWEVVKYYGIGEPTAIKLNKIGIKTIKDLAEANEIDVQEAIGKVAKTYIEQAKGNGDNNINIEHNELKGIGNSITFLSDDKIFRQDILLILKDLCFKVSNRAQNRNLVGFVIQVSIKETLKGRTSAKSKQKTLKIPISKATDIFKEATAIFDELWNEEDLKFIGVSLMKLENMFEVTYQDSIFNENNEKSKIKSILDEVNRKFKKKVIFTGKEGKRNAIKKQNQSRYIENDLIIKHYDEEFK